MGGDFFNVKTLPKADPAGQDIFVLRAVLHDWADAEAQRILINLRTAIGRRANCEVELSRAPYCVLLLGSVHTNQLQCFWVCLMSTFFRARDSLRAPIAIVRASVQLLSLGGYVPSAGSAKNATLAIVETIVNEDLRAEDMPIRRMIDVLMMATVDGKERSQAGSLRCRLSCLRMLLSGRSSILVLCACEGIRNQSWLLYHG